MSAQRTTAVCVTSRVFSARIERALEQVANANDADFFSIRDRRSGGPKSWFAVANLGAPFTGRFARDIERAIADAGIEYYGSPTR